jgi:hypothetical protein
MASKKKIDAAGSAVFDKLFSSSKDAQNDSQDVSPAPMDKRSASEKETAEKGQKPSKKVFSFRGDQTAVTAWRVYADAAGMKVDDLGYAALTEYIENHPLTAEQKQIYDLKLKQKS